MRSMTGMGRATGVVNGLPVRVEIKTVNHRFCEVCFRAPGKYATLEIPIQRLVKDSISRGRIDVFLFEEKSTVASTPELEAYKSCYHYLNQIKTSLGLKEDVSMSVLMDSVSGWISRDLDSDAAFQEILPALKQALQDLDRMRLTEGARLKKYFEEYFQTIQAITVQIAHHSDSVQSNLKAKFQQRMAEKQAEIGDVDPQRLMQEVVFYLDRMSITEELDRLNSHLKLQAELLAGKEPVGRKMDFLLQEFNREFNTIGSKSAHSEIAHLVVEAKSTLEKIREQVQNIE